MPSLGQRCALSLAGEVSGGDANGRRHEALSLQVVQSDRAGAVADLCGRVTKQVTGRMNLDVDC